MDLRRNQDNSRKEHHESQLEAVQSDHLKALEEKSAIEHELQQVQKELRSVQDHKGMLPILTKFQIHRRRAFQYSSESSRCSKGQDYSSASVLSTFFTRNLI
jgi:hypothetical protein